MTNKPKKVEAEVLAPAFAKEGVKVVMLPVKNLFVKWHSAQRKEKIITHAKKIAADFDPDRFGVLVVTLPDDKGLHHIVDGVHRRTAVDLMWGGEQQVPCQVLPIKDPVRAAKVFLGLQSRRPVSPIDNFRVSVQAENPDSLIIDKVVRSVGYKIDSTKHDGYICAVGALSHVYRRYGPDVLHDSLVLIQATWGLDPNAVNGPIIQAYARLLGDYHMKLNYGRLKEVMLKRFANPMRLLATAKSFRELSGGSSTEAIYKCLVDNYNRGLKKGFLN